MPTTPQLHVRELTEADIPLIAHYWTSASADYLRGMGADIAKVPAEADFINMLTHQHQLPIAEKRAYALIWGGDGVPVGHCNVNPISFGEEASMHLHFWQQAHRMRGLGTELVRQSLPLFFERLQLKRLICEPYAHNPAPNKTLAKLGFELERTYRTVPGSINFEQEVNRWVLSREALA